MGPRQVALDHTGGRRSRTTPALAIVCGLSDERRVVAHSDALVLCGASAVANLDRMVPADCAGVLSFGLCGALAPTLRVGDIILGSSVRDGHDKSYLVNQEWLNRLSSKLRRLRPKSGSMWSEGVEAAHAIAERAKLFATTGCLAIDDESKAVAEVANARRLPFAVVRVVSDDARTALPSAVRHATHPDGRLNINAVLAAVRSSPSQILALEKIVFDFGYAIGRLRDVYRIVRPQFCFEE